MTTRSATYREPITIEQKTEGQDVTGDPDASASWSTFASPYAAIEHQISAAGTGDEDEQDQVFEEERNLLFKIRHRSGVTVNMRVVYDGQNYDIKSVGDPDGRKRELHINAKLTESH